MRNLIGIWEMVPAGVVLLVAASAASTAYLVQRRATPGRNRGAMAYQAGFLAGLAATLGIATGSTALTLAMIEDAPIAEAGMLASFIGPFAGMVHAELRAVANEECEQSAASRASQTFRPFRNFLDSLSPKSRSIPS